MEQERVYNFGAGPACLPESVLKQAQQELLNYRKSGMSIMEISHRSKLFEETLNTAISNLRTLLKIPANYKVLFFQGGGTGQFAAVPLNLFSDSNRTADYFITGNWSQRAIEEAKKYGNPNVVCTGEKTKFTTIPPASEWNLNPNAAYIYYCANETVYGVEFPDPDIQSKLGSSTSLPPLVVDMSSNFLSKSIDVSKYGIIYAGAQKNSGISGVTVAIVREDLIKSPRPETPTILSYKVASDNNSLYNTPPTFSIYMAGLTYQWILEQGGCEEMERRSQIKSQKIYQAIDSSQGFYRCPVDPAYRSRINIPFRIKDDKLEPQFIKEAAAKGMVELAGHRSVGGIRVSLYNALPMEAVDLLVQFMQEFQQRHQSQQ
jgi:phosphoserine aminotransferase